MTTVPPGGAPQLNSALGSAAAITGPAAVGGPDGLRSTAARSVKWAFVQMIGGTGGRLMFTLVLARFLGPGDFGIVAQAAIYVGLAMLLLDQGFGSVLVQRRELDTADVRSVATLNLLLSVGLMTVTLVLAPLVAAFFRTPELTAVLRVLGIGLVVKGLAIVPLMMTRRAFGFRQRAPADIGSTDRRNRQPRRRGRRRWILGARRADDGQ